MGEFRIPSTRQADLGSGEVLMSSPASYISTCILRAKDPGLWWNRAPASTGDGEIKTEQLRGLLPSFFLRVSFSFYLCKTEQRTRPALGIPPPIAFLSVCLYN